MTRIDLGPYQALLFDMDGTILTSIAAVERAWTAWALRASLDVAAVLDYMHGRRALDTIRHFLPDDANANAEAHWLEAQEMEDLDGISEIPGARDLLGALPAAGWAVVTSATRGLALRRIAAAGLPLPGVLISADDVPRGKPDPAGYLMGAARLGVDPARCLVLEDAEAGMRAGLAAGAQVLRILGPANGSDPGAHATVSGYTGAEVLLDQGLIRLKLTGH